MLSQHTVCPDPPPSDGPVVAGALLRRNSRSNGGDETVSVSKGDLVVRHNSGSFLTRRFVVIRRIGAGSFGSVDLLRDRHNGAERVCKTVNTRGMSPEVLSQMKKEIMLLQELDHPRIVRMYEYTENIGKGMFQLVLEYLPGGTCSTLLDGGRRPSEDLVANLMQQVLSAAAYCHARGIVHCDLKPENVLLTGPAACPPAGYGRRGQCLGKLAAAPFRCTGCGEEAELLMDCKVIDFGLAAHFAPSEPEAIGKFAGTPAYVAPEVVGTLSGGCFGPKADIWSVGVMTHYLLTGRLPFGHPQGFDGDYRQIFQAIRDFQEVDFMVADWAGRSDEACGFVGEAMRRDTKLRPSAVEALAHEWLKERGAARSKRLQRWMLRSMRDFARAAPLVKICLLLIASRSSGKRFRRCARAFKRLDLTGAGSISLESLQDAIDKPGGYCPSCCYPRVDARELFRDLTFGQGTGIEYTEFAAACLFAELGSKGGRELASIAFEAFDDDGDGLVTADAIFALFSPEHRQDMPLLSFLPLGRPLDIKEFYRCLRRAQGSRRRLLCPLLCCGSAAQSGSFDELFSEVVPSSPSSSSGSESEEA